MQLKYLWSEIDQLTDLVSKAYAYVMTCYCKSLLLLPFWCMRCVCVCVCVYDGDIIFFSLSSENTNQTGNHPANHGASGLWVTFGGPLVGPGQESSLPSSMVNHFLPATLGRSGPTYQKSEGSFSPWRSRFLCNLTHLLLSSAFPGSTGKGHPGSSTASPCAYKTSGHIQEPCSHNEKLLLFFCFFL